jgi:hypothetical protein
MFVYRVYHLKHNPNNNNTLWIKIKLEAVLTCNRRVVSQLRVIREKNMVRGLVGPRTRNDCAGKVQQQFTQNRELVTDSLESMSH